MQEDEEIRCGENNVEWVVCSRIYYRRNHLNQGRMSLSGKLGKCSSDRAWQPELALTLNNSILMLLLLSWTLQLSKTTNIETQRFRKTRSKKKKTTRKNAENSILVLPVTVRTQFIIPEDFDFHVQQIGRSVTLHLNVKLYAPLL